MAMFSLLSFFLLYFIGTFGEDITRCPPNLKRDDYLHAHKDRCFEFVIFRTRTWSQAEKECEQSAGKLVTDNDESTHEFLVSKLKAHGYTGSGVWIGLTDRVRENYYKWVSGESLKFTKWAPGQPSRFFHGFEDCIFMSRLHEYSWDDHRCELVSHYGYICEYKMVIPHTAPTTVSSTTTTNTTASSTTTTNTTTATMTATKTVPTITGLVQPTTMVTGPTQPSSVHSTTTTNVMQVNTSTTNAPLNPV